MKRSNWQLLQLRHRSNMELKLNNQMSFSHQIFRQSGSVSTARTANRSLVVTGTVQVARAAGQLQLPVARADECPARASAAACQ